MAGFIVSGGPRGLGGAPAACRLNVSCGEPLLSGDMAHANTWCWGTLSL